MKTISITMLVLLGGALISSLLIQGVTGMPSDTKRDYEEMSDTDTDIEMVYTTHDPRDIGIISNDLPGVTGMPYDTKRDYEEMSDTDTDIDMVYPTHDPRDGNDKQEEKRGIGDLFKLSADAISAASDAISAGTSLVGTSLQALMSTGDSIVCGIEIDNYSKWLLSDAQTYPKAGYVSTPARAIQPGKREAMVVHKGGGATGTYGTVTWLVNNNNNQRIIVMWSAPYSFDWHSNWLAIGIISDGYEGAHWFDTMYYGSGSFERGEYYYHSKSMDYCNNDMCLTGTMGTSHKPQVLLAFYPTSVENLAYDVKTLID